MHNFLVLLFPTLWKYNLQALALLGHFLSNFCPQYSYSNFFIFRNVPKAYLSDFCCEDDESKEKLEDLKERVKKSGLEQFK